MKLIFKRKIYDFQLFYLLIVGLFFINNMFCSEDFLYNEFPPDEYEHYMQLIQEIDAAVHNQLRECQRIHGSPCLRDAGDERRSFVEGPSVESKGYPIIVMKSIKDFSKIFQETHLEFLLDKYNSYEIASPITLEEQKKVMDVIKELAPELWQEIEKVDPNGVNHIKRNYENNVSIYFSKIDGLPEIYVNNFIMNLSFNELKYTIGHELGHYVLGHFEKPVYAHKALSKKEEGEQAFIKGKKVSSQLAFQETFELAYSRTEEDEADRFAILELGVNIDDAISGGKKMKDSEKEEVLLLLGNPQKETFKRMHKLWADRIKHLESLRREIEIRRGRKPAPINWKKLAEDYKQQYEAGTLKK